MQVVLNRALSLATRGVLAGSAIALATHGLIQVPQTVDIPVVEVPIGTGGGTSYGDFWLGVPAHFTHSADLRLLLSSETLAWLSPLEPITIESLEPTGLRGYFDAQARLQIISEAQWRHIDQAVIDADDIEVFLLLAAHRLQKEDEPHVWPNEKFT